MPVTLSSLLEKHNYDLNFSEPKVHLSFCSFLFRAKKPRSGLDHLAAFIFGKLYILLPGDFPHNLMIQ